VYFLSFCGGDNGGFLCGREKPQRDKPYSWPHHISFKPARTDSYTPEPTFTFALGGVGRILCPGGLPQVHDAVVAFVPVDVI
jgi:hypothetical protein